MVLQNLSLTQKLMSNQEIQEFFEILEQRNPDPRGELIYQNPFTLLVAVVLSAQSTDKAVNKATEPLFKIADTPEKMLDLTEDQLKNYIKTIGFANTKSRNIRLLCQQLLDHFHGQVPSTLEDLISLAGVGQKTANVVLNIIFNQPTLAVDTHVFRVANRTGLAFAKTPEKIEIQLLERIPQYFLLQSHHWLILHGRYTCKAVKPLCNQCPVILQCQYPSKNI